MNFKVFLIISGLVIMSCNSKVNPSFKLSDSFDSQGHRGCRGLLPENTVLGFIKALDLGVKTLELDVVISGDDQVVVSHEAFFNHEISTGPNGEEISKSNEKDHNLYKLTYAEIKAYDVGLKPHKRFMDQVKMKASKPLLRDVVQSSDAHARKSKRPIPYYNVEIKRVASFDGKYNPPVEKFVDLVIDQVYSLGIEDRTTIQSFDLETLRLVHQKKEKQSTALLIENTKSVEQNLENLGYKPNIYSCHYMLLSAEKVAYLHGQGIKIIPWTVNEKSDIKNIIELGVDGIISDYPDRVNEVINELNSQ